MSNKTVAVYMQTEQKARSLKEEFNTILSQLEEMRKRKVDRKNQFLEVIGQIQNVFSEIYGSDGYDSSKAVVDENDLTLRKLEELQKELQSLQKEKVRVIRISCAFPFSV